MTPMKNIYLIDDDKLFIFLTKKTIQSTTFAVNVKEFGDGQEAIDYLEDIGGNPELLPDMIFLDLSMPVMDGWDFINEFTKLAAGFKNKPKLYIFSSSISPHDIERAKQYDVVADFLIKPLSKEKIIELLQD